MIAMAMIALLAAAPAQEEFADLDNQEVEVVQCEDSENEDMIVYEDGEYSDQIVFEEENEDLVTCKDED